MKRVILLGLLVGTVAYADTSPSRGTIEPMAKSTSAWSPTFSPDGDRIAFVSDLSGVPQVWTVAADGGFPSRLTDLEDTVSSVSWSPSGDWLAISAAPGGGMNTQISLVSPDGLRHKQITSGGRETNFGGIWQESGTNFACSSNVKSASSAPSYVYSVGDENTRLVGLDQGLNRVFAIHPQGDSILVGRLAGRGDNNIYLINTKSGAETLLTPHDAPGTFFGQYGHNSDQIYVGHNKNRDKIAFGVIDPDGHIQTIVHRDDAELENFRVVPESELVALLWNNHGMSELELYDLSSQVRRLVAIPAEVIGTLTVSQDGKKLAVSARGAIDPTNVYVIDVDTLQVTKLTQSSRPGVDTSALVRPELMKFKAHDGLELSGWLYRPKGTESPSAYVISFHGGPEGQERPAFRSVYQALLANGIGVFAPNIRGSSGFGKHFVNLDNRELRFDANKDIASCAEFLIETGIAHKDGIGIMGGSYGGYAVMVGVTEYPGLFAAGVNLFGMVNFETFFANTEPWMAAISGTEYGDPDTQKDLLKQLSPIHKLDQVETPLLVLHGANDTNVPVIEAEQVVAELERRNIPVKYILFEDEGHGFRKEANRVTSDVESVGWFAKYLGIIN